MIRVPRIPDFLLHPRWLLLGCALLSACVGAAYLRLSQRDRIIIPHDKHKAAKVECVACHEAVFDSKILGDRVIPEEKTCMQCHKEKQHECSMCHSDVKARTTMNRLVAAAKPGAILKHEPELKMSHSAHIERVKEDCSFCHKELPNPVRQSEHTPAMATCLGCHEHKQQYDSGQCRECHTDLKRFALKPVSDFSHAGNFVKDHKRAARTSGATCADCHDQSFCTDCHTGTVAERIEILLPERVERDFIHRNDFRSRHAMEASHDSVSCARCHGQTFCSTCHAAQGLTPTATNPRSPHPAGYALPGSGQSHGTDARRDIAACASCHDQGAKSICVDCHRTGGIGGNPHPSGWTQRHPHSEIGSNNMCLQCHQ